MRPAARLQSAIEILDKIIIAAREKTAPADRILATWFKEHRFAGSKDKRAIRELVYSAIRKCGPVPRHGRAAMHLVAQGDDEMLALFDGSQYGPKKLGDREEPATSGVAPEWLEDRLIASEITEEEAAGLLSRAPLDIRVNTLMGEAEGLELPIEAETLAVPNALRLPSGTQIEQWEAFKSGLIEVQDAGSQLACLAVDAKPDEVVIDLCAGAGGKTLALAAAMKNEGTLIAADVDRRRLSQLPPRAERAGAILAENILLNPNEELEALDDWLGKADAVVIDAPCSGTGTWRRNPESRWRLDQEELDRLTFLQGRLLEIAAKLVKSGGRIIYITCSQLDEEGVRQVQRFLSFNTEFEAQELELPLGTKRRVGTRLTPSQDGTDGFFIASLKKS